ncbi:Predicted ATP-dependent endonuclease of the OLD family, contains P-loop ATPase and TOPRIM domains [Nitrosospira multiformis]|uniref:Predicted ATP-dependent endonuclease of the OLD family, contains P-loop ATPase and TOPRIM domains n=1 Tax=Nitrosospira multiformis TaxID=1231 RepID=A0A1I0C191_9PROT|nr:AAA family ATPase [Nitrosospira multiformis]SET12718.1 Predicted ATP-dependent endonuclease of the OLD family, contains P-loop ATPase and TOPRIM domains [Nitrosospira multiformis]
MHIKNISVKNFRLLHDIDLLLESKTTVIVGRNNSGKTSLTEVIKRLLTENNVTFRLEDFSFGTHRQFWSAFIAATQGVSESEVRKILPAIEIRLNFSYEIDEPLGMLSDFIVDLDPDCTEALVVARYALKEGRVKELFAALMGTDENARPEVFRVLRDRVPSLFGLSFAALDPNDPTNERAVEGSLVRALCASGFISAQRGLDDATQKDRVVIGKVLESLFTTAKINAADSESYNTAAELEIAVSKIQEDIGEDFNAKLNTLLPALSIFGYPGLSDLKLLTETTLDVERLLTNHTKVRYTGANGIHLPETYNGLGARNIILILLQLREFFKLYLAMEPRPAVQVVFIEEPEVHLHPQMQEVFIRKLDEIATVFSKEQGVRWPVQFIVSTHSSHVANEAHFETIRYFLSTVDEGSSAFRTIVKDLRKGLLAKGEPEKAFLHQYMTLTRCDLFFADKAILIEGTTERLLLPRIMEIIDEGQPEGNKLGSQYISVMEVGGAYAHIFFGLLEFLEIPTLIITDIDTVKPNGKGRYEACPVSDGERSSNTCIKAWFDNPTVTPAHLLAAEETKKICGKKRLAFQQPEEKDGPCGRSFEDAFMLANKALFEFPGPSVEECAAQAWLAARDVKKSEFVLQHAITVAKWNIPRYIRDGLVWLANNDVPQSSVATPSAEFVK